MTIQAVVFDAYGTLYDVQSAQAQAEALCPGKGEVITHVWRLKQLEYTWLRSLLQEYQDFWEVTRASLKVRNARGRGRAQRRHLRTPDGELSPPRPYPEAREALAALAGRKLAILSNGTPGMLQKLVRNSGLNRWIEAAISIDGVRTYKPHRSCYALVEPVLEVPKEEVLFVSSNSFDVVGAKAFGFKVAWIRRSGGSSPVTMFGMLRGRAEELGHAPDHVVSALSELPKLL